MALFYQPLVILSNIYFKAHFVRGGDKPAFELIANHLLAEEPCEGGLRWNNSVLRQWL